MPLPWRTSTLPSELSVDLTPEADDEEGEDGDEPPPLAELPLEPALPLPFPLPPALLELFPALPAPFPLLEPAPFPLLEPFPLLPPLPFPPPLPLPLLPSFACAAFVVGVGNGPKLSVSGKAEITRATVAPHPNLNRQRLESMIASFPALCPCLRR